MVLTVSVIGCILPSTYMDVLFRNCSDLVIDKVERLMTPSVLRKCGISEGISFLNFFLPESRNPVQMY